MNSPSIILDGEMLVWDPVSGRNLPFGTLKTAALGTFSLTGRNTVIYYSQINPRKA
jgi:ATP-dependent DNA ligase